LQNTPIDGFTNTEVGKIVGVSAESGKIYKEVCETAKKG
jgi:hypothetical protein